MVITWDIAIPELTGKELRWAYIYLPEAYFYGPNKRFPVLYMFDGHNVFFDSHATYGKSWGMKEFMDSTDTPLIIAAVECNHSPDHGRLSEYSPYTFSDPRFGSITGRGRQTMEWLVHTFKKNIDARYRTLPDRAHTYIAGSSMGGLMSLYALLEYNQYFSRAAALSPSLWVSMERILRMIQTAKLHPETFLYMDYGSREMNRHTDMMEQFTTVAAKLYQRNIFLDCRIVPGGTHSEASWERQIPFFMNTLLYQI